MSEQNAIEFLRRVAGIAGSFATAKDLSAPTAAPDFSVFDFIQPDELCLSQILAWLLNAKGSHAQGSRFLQAFSRRFDLGWSEVECMSSRVAVERTLDTGRRIDIIVACTTKSIAIENKPWAGDQREQVRDYLDWLARERASFGAGNRLIYLSSNGQPPTAWSIEGSLLATVIADGRLVVIGYPHLLPWLEECRAANASDRISSFVRELEAYIRREFTGETNMVQSDHLLSMIASDSSSIRGFFLAVPLAERLRRTLMQKLADDLHQVLPDAFSIKTGVVYNGAWNDLSIVFHQRARYEFKVEPRKPNTDNVIYGLRRRDQTVDVSADRDRLQSQLGLAQQDKDFAWFKHCSVEDPYIPAPQNWQHDPQPWEDISKGVMARKVAEAARSFKLAINDDELL